MTIAERNIVAILQRIIDQVGTHEDNWGLLVKWWRLSAESDSL